MTDPSTINLPHSQATPSAARRTIYAIVGGLFLYGLLLLNFRFYEEALTLYAYRVAFNPAKIPIAIAIISMLGTVLALAVPSHRSIVGVFAHLCFAVSFVPLCAAYTISDGSTAFLVSCGGALALSFILFGRRYALSTNSTASVDSKIALFFIILMCGAISYLAISGSLSVSFISFNDVYQLRSDADFGFSPRAGRIITTSAYTATSFILVFGILRRKITFIGLGMANSYLLYSTFGFKLFLFFPFIVLSIFVYYRAKNSYIILFALIILLSASYLINAYEYNFAERALDMTVRRYLYTPGFISLAWHDTFIDEPYVMLSNISIIKNFIQYPFDVPYSSIVAQKIFDTESNPNTNVLGYGFANFGYFGVFSYSVFTFGCMMIIDRIAVSLNSGYLRLGTAPLTVLFLEADPIVAIISFGFGVILIISVGTQILAACKPLPNSLANAKS